MEPEENIGPGKGRPVQKRKARKDGWTDKRRQAFLDHVAACSNISAAVAAVGLSAPGLYALLKRDAEFAAAVEEAMGFGYLQVESLAIERSARRRGYRPGDTEVADPGEMDPDLALNLLRLRGSHKKAGAKPSGPKPRKASAEELSKAILSLLAVLNRRLGKAG